MPTEVRPNEQASAQNGQSRIASPTVGPTLAEACARATPGAPSPGPWAMRRHGRTSNTGMKAALIIANTR